ncbi:Uncharacterized protein HZ326_14377 [Fusarium oxysporum f. sp. albedinis]|nr:Uncharacterized protein HZ326_14377 [Fusarium oxysporum f. sp. albedinis]
MISRYTDRGSTAGLHIPARPVSTDCYTTPSNASLRRGRFTLVQPPKSLREWTDRRGKPVPYENLSTHFV